MDVAAYCRCSTATQEDSPEVQLGLIAEFCEREGHKIVAGYVDEAVSGGTAIETRPGFAQLLAERKGKGFEAVVILKLDRISRDLFDYLSFERTAKAAKLQVIFASEQYEDSASGDLMRYVKGAFSEFERRQTGERVREHNRQAAKAGRLPSGQAPLGYTYDPLTKIISVDEGRAADVIAVFQTFIGCQGNKSLTAKRLNSMGIRTRDAGLWRDDGVALTLRNPFYRGRMHYMDVSVESERIPPLVPANLLRAVDNLLAATKGRASRAPQRTHLYSGILICAQCGSTFAVKDARGRYTIYTCRGHKERGICSASMVTTTWLDPMVADGLRIVLEGELAALRAYHEAHPPTDEPPTDQTERIAALETRKVRLREMYLAGLMDSVDELQRELAETDALIADLSRTEPLRPFTAEDLEALVKDFPAYWAKAGVVDRRQLLLAVSPRIIVHEKGRITMDTTLSAGPIDLPLDSAAKGERRGDRI